VRYAVFFIIGCGLWLLLTLTLNVDHLIAGFVIVSLSTFAFGGYFTHHPLKFLQPHRLFWFIIYVPVFTWYMLKANIDVAYRVLHPEMPIKPGIVKVRTKLKTDVGKVFLANSITLTPGTMTCDIVGEHLYIHWIWVSSPDIEKATAEIVKPFEGYIRRIFE
jgi:multicomponent Na+:H+ antiporter subunit E